MLEPVHGGLPSELPDANDLVRFSLWSDAATTLFVTSFGKVAAATSVELE